MNPKLIQSKKNLLRALASLEKALATPPVEDRDYAGIIQNFEFVYELTWKTLKLILDGRGIDAAFPRVVFEESFKQGLVEGNEIWKAIAEGRNLSVHTYDQSLALKLYEEIRDSFLPIFQSTVQKIEVASV